MKFLKKFNESFKIEYFPMDKVKVIQNIIKDYFSDDIDIERVEFLDNWEKSENIKYFIRVLPKNDLPTGAIESFIKRENQPDPYVGISFVTKESLEDLGKLNKMLERLPKILEQEGLYTYMSYDPTPYNNTNGKTSGNVYIDITIRLEPRAETIESNPGEKYGQ